jgi:hypothetical protein
MERMLRAALVLLVVAAVPATAAAQDVKVGATPADAEVNDQRTIPVIQSSSATNDGSRVVMRLRRSQNDLPGLMGGDRLDTVAELQFTTDPAYSYAPNVRARLLLTRDPDARVADGTTAVKLGEAEEEQCSQREHHCVLVFRTIRGFVGSTFADPCGLAAECFINVVANAWHPNANVNGNQRVLIGENEPNGSVEGDKGSVGVVRARGAFGESTTVNETPAAGSYPVTDNTDGDRFVVFRTSLGQLHAGDELSYDFVMTTKPTASFPIRVSSQVIVGNGQSAVTPIGDIYPDGGKVSRFNGENCLAGGPCTTRHVGVFRADRDFNQGLWLVVLAKSAAPFDNAGDNRYQVKITGGHLNVTRYTDAD